MPAHEITIEEALGLSMLVPEDGTALLYTTPDEVKIGDVLFGLLVTGIQTANHYGREARKLTLGNPDSDSSSNRDLGTLYLILDTALVVSREVER